MSTTTTISAEQLSTLPHDGQRYELVAGELHKISPSGWKHGEIVGDLHGMIWAHVRAHELGKVFGAETGFLLSRDPDTVRAPDIAFIAKENLPETDPSDAFWPGPPDLAVEVLSPGDRTGEVDEKIQSWLAAGARLVWVVDAKLRTVTSYRSATDVETRTATDDLDGGTVVRGFRCGVAEIFGPAGSGSG